MNIKEIKDMIDLMNKNNLHELEVETNGMKVRLVKSGAGITQQILDDKLAVREIVTQVHPQEKPLVEAKPRNTIEIKAPMVGTFYGSPSPEAPPFVEIGATVDKGQVICIIEAMKLMNEIKSEVKGKIVDILAENASPIEYGQVLFLIEPA